MPLKSKIVFTFALSLAMFAVSDVNAGCYGNGGGAVRGFGRMATAPFRLGGFRAMRHQQQFQQSAGYTIRYRAWGSVQSNVQSYSASACQGGACVAPAPASAEPKSSESTPKASESTAPTAKPKAVVTAPVGDPYGFHAWLNYYRQINGLMPLAHDPNLSAWAHANNVYGVGHAVLAARRQNSGGNADIATIANAWMNSAGHRDAMLDPYARTYGIAYSNGCWTFNAN